MSWESKQEVEVYLIALSCNLQPTVNRSAAWSNKPTRHHAQCTIPLANSHLRSVCFLETPLKSCHVCTNIRTLAALVDRSFLLLVQKGDSKVLHSRPDQHECRVGRLCAMPHWILRQPIGPCSLNNGEEVTGNFKP